MDFVIVTFSLLVAMIQGNKILCERRTWEKSKIRENSCFLKNEATNPEVVLALIFFFLPGIKECKEKIKQRGPNVFSLNI